MRGDFMLKNALKTMAATAAAVGCAILGEQLGIGNESIIMVFLLGVLATAVLTSSRAWAIACALVSVLLFNFLFTAPLYTFQVYSTSDFILLVFFLVTAIVSGSITCRLKKEKELAGQNEKTADTLYSIASAFLSAGSQDSIVSTGRELVSEHTGLACDITLSPDYLPDGAEVYEIDSQSGNQGELVLSGDSPSERQALIIQAICTQMGAALERERLVSERNSIELAMEKEQQRSMLLRSVAHDLRSPLTALSGAGNLLADNYNELSDSQRRKLASDVSEEIVWLTDLVENILNMTRISENQLVIQRQDEVIDDVVGEAVKHTERLLRGREFSVSLPDEVVTAPMDARLITQVITNLLENAARHTPPDSAITLSAVAGAEVLTVSVSDTGAGVPDNIRGRLFERFVTQEDRIVDGRQGLGLGLAICKSIVEAHGGTISYRDNNPHGAVFSFTLPLEA